MGQDRVIPLEQIDSVQAQVHPCEMLRIVCVDRPPVEIPAGAHRAEDLVILRSQRRRVGGLPIPASDRTSSLVSQLPCPSMVISEPLL